MMAKLTLENYIDFHQNPQNLDILSIRHLNQIISMHGFIKLHNRPKREVMDALCSIDALLPPIRSTLQENISSCAVLTLEQVKDDLAKLEWQECPVQSIETPLKSAAEDHIPFVCGSSSMSSPGWVNAKGTRSKKRKRKELKTVMDSCPSPAATAAAAAATATATAAAAAAAAGNEPRSSWLSLTS